MTPNQLRTLDLVRDSITISGFSPTIREIADQIGVTVSGAHRIVESLNDARHLARVPAQTRGLRVVDVPDLRAVSTLSLEGELARRGVTLAALMPRERGALGPAVSCAADTCGNEVRPGMLMCRTHWFALPSDLQGRIKRTFSLGDVRGYQAAVSEARDLIDGGDWRARA